jgi:DNA-binding transcriptional LysR family regulator
MDISDTQGSASRSRGSALGRSRAADADHAAVELDWLETFLAVVDRGGFTAASEQVHRSQSRVSAHIAALERELGVRLIDRTRRPAAVTTAGQVFARHAREIVAGVGSARSAVGALRAMDEESLSVLTTPCIGVALFPGVLSELALAHPGVRLALSEQSSHDVERRFSADGVVVAVLPTLPHPLAPGLRERLLWRERIRMVVLPDHPLARGGAVPPDQLVQHPLIVSGTSAEIEPELLPLLTARGLAVQPRACVDTPQTLVAMARAGVGVGVANAVALEHTDTSGLVVVDLDDPDMVREVAAYWYEVLVTTGVGKALLRTVLEAPVPRGAVAAPRHTGARRDVPEEQRR